MCERLRDALPDDVVLIVTGDHGMVDVPRRNQILAEDEPELMAGVDALAGEGRFRQLYVDHDRAVGGGRPLGRPTGRAGLGADPGRGNRGGLVRARRPRRCGSAGVTCWWPCGPTGR